MLAGKGRGGIREGLEGRGRYGEEMGWEGRVGRKQSRTGARCTPRAQGRYSAQGVVRVAVGVQAARSSIGVAAQGRYSAVRIADAAQE